MTETPEAFLLHLVDVVWGEAHENESVPSTPWARRMIEKARETFEPPKAGEPCPVCAGADPEDGCKLCFGTGLVCEPDREESPVPAELAEIRIELVDSSAYDDIVRALLQAGVTIVQRHHLLQGHHLLVRLVP